MSAKIDLIGQRFGRLIVLEEAGKTKGKRQKIVWKCKCDCGKEKSIIGDSLRSGSAKSCGCSIVEKIKERNFKHGYAHKERLYGIWRGMYTRCYNKNFKFYNYYGGRGISICDEWLNNYLVFRKWAYINGYEENLTIDRKDNDGNYEPNNCKWVSGKNQANNKSNNHCVTFHGKTKTLSQWAEETKISSRVIESRLNRLGWSIDKALTTPIKRHVCNG